jgi:hypothetical protein
MLKSQNSDNPSSWRYKMGIPRPPCCVSLSDEFQQGPASFFAFKSYVERNKLNRAKILGTFSDRILPTWYVEDHGLR